MLSRGSAEGLGAGGASGAGAGIQGAKTARRNNRSSAASSPEALVKIGRTAEGLNHLKEAEQKIEATEERWREAEMHRVYGELLIDAGDSVSAEVRFERAITVARQQSAKLWEIRAAYSLARLWRDQGKRVAARDLLTTICGWFTEGFDTPVLQDAKALLDEVAS